MPKKGLPHFWGNGRPNSRGGFRVNFSLTP